MAEAAGSGGGCEQQKAGGGQGALASGAATAPLQPRRKFSLPWFRQSSVGISATASKRLPKQHTIGGFGGPTGPNDSLGNLEETLVLADSNANGPGELSVQRGQQVEVVGLPPGPPGQPPGNSHTASSGAPAAAAAASAGGGGSAGNNMVIVRLSSGSEGLVPLTCLKQPTGGFKFKNGLGSFKDEDNGAHSDKIGNNGGNVAGLASKKKGGFGGKWLPNIRKLSQGRGDKALADASKLASTAGTGVNRDPKQNFKLSKPPMGNKLGHGEVGNEAAAGGSADSQRPPSGSTSGSGRPPPAATASSSSTGSASGVTSSVAVHNKKGKAGHQSGVEPGGGNHQVAQDCDTNDEQVFEVPAPMEPMNPIPVSNSDKLGLPPSGSNSTGVDPSGDPTPSSPGGLNKPNDSCDSVDATTRDNNAFSNDAVPAGSSAGSSGASVITADSVEKAIQERSYRLQELLDSERIYVSDLAHCCQYIQYMRESKDKEDHEIPMPEDLREGKDRMIFGNIEAIYEWHRDNFLKNLESCIDKPIELGLLFKKYDRKFQMYVVYCQNKPKSEYIVSEYIDTYFEEIRLKLGFKLRLTDLLIKPIQRLTKYHMLLEAIVKYSQRAGCTEEAEALSKAFHVMTVVPNQANDMMDIGRLQGFEGKITAQGKLLHRGPLVALDNFDTKNKEKDTKPIMKPFTCFLFEQIMIFSETVGKKTQFTSPVYVYKAHFLVNKMALDEKTNDDPCQFLIKSNDPARDELKILCQAESEESKKKWLGILKRQLQTQMDFLRALQAPIAYHNRLANDYLDPWDVTPADASKDQKKGQSKGQKSLKALKSVILKSPTSPIHPSPPVAPPSGKTASRPRTQSNINPPNLMSAASAASIASYPSSGSGNASAATSVVVTSGMASSPKSPIIAEVSPAYRRWSEATASIDTSASGGKKNNEWSSNFERSYMEMEELGRGRFSVVRRCHEIMSGNDVAVKFVNRRKQGEPETLREYRHLAQLNHPHIISSLGLYLTSNSYAIVLTLVPGGKPFLEKFCQKSTYAEVDVFTYMNQTLKALNYLHHHQNGMDQKLDQNATSSTNQGLVHLDLKPENVILDSKSNAVKLIDFGCAQSLARINQNSSATKAAAAAAVSSAAAYESTEFLAPELVNPAAAVANSTDAGVACGVGTYTDMWAFAVLLYVALSGLSPFLDDSLDETNANIMRGDFSFPEEYFARVSKDAKDLIQCILQVNPAHRVTSGAALESSWFKTHGQKTARIPTTHLTTFVRRRKKKLNSITLLPVGGNNSPISVSGSGSSHLAGNTPTKESSPRINLVTPTNLLRP